MAPNAEIQDIITMTSSHSKVHSLKAAIFHTMAYKLSLEINNNKITPKSLIAFLMVSYIMSPKSKRNTLHLNNIQGFMSPDQKLPFVKRLLMSFLC